MATEYKYSAIQIRQTPSSIPFYVIGVAAPELLEWCDVPRKKSDFMAGYQRELLDRYSKVTEFIQKNPEKNLIPGAIIVALKEESFRVDGVREGGDESLANGSESHIESGEGARSGLIAEVTIRLADYTFQERLTQLAQEFFDRLGMDEKASIEPAVHSDDLIEEDEESTVEDSPPDSYLAQLAKELRDAASDFQSLSQERQEAVRSYIDGVSKPGLILDGQHRVFGAKDVSDFDVVLPVVLMPGLKQDEQVFHFYVLNNKAKPLLPTELRGTISTSLSRHEIGKLYDRFKQAGITAEEARWTHKANTDDASPFRGLIDFGLGVESAFIPENVMHQAIGKFVKLPRRYRLLYAEVSAWSSQGPDEDPEKIYEYRLARFYDFWGTVMKTYPKAWDEGVENHGKPCKDAGYGQIFFKAAMLVLQEYVLNKLNGDMPSRRSKGENSPLGDPEDFRQSVSAALYFVPEEFFTRQWQVKGLDTGPGRKLLLEQFQECEQRGGEKIGHLRLFRQTS